MAYRKFLVFQLMVFVSCLCCVGAIPDGRLKNIEQAVSGEAIVKPAKVHRVLVFSRTDGFRHKSIPYCNKALELMGEKTGVFEVTFSEDMSVFTAENLKQFDAIVFNNSVGLDFGDSGGDKALLDFVRSGKGVAAIHSATDSFANSPEVAEMLGGRFDGHPWKAKETWAVKLDEPQHTLTAVFGGEGFKIRDEIYRHQPVGLRERCRVLISLDMNDDATRSVKGLRPTDNDVPVSWVRPYGKGRVFYGCFGHKPDIFWNPEVLSYYLAGIQYCLGDLKIDDEVPKPNTLTESEIKAGWKLLFDGKSAHAFRKGKQGKNFPEKGWEVKDGVLTVCPGGERGPSITTRERYGDFEFKIDFKVTDGANSGIKYFVREDGGLEYQILDDKRLDDKVLDPDSDYGVGCLYDLMPAKNKMVNPVGQWNHARIVAKGRHVEHWLNGIKVLEYERDSDNFARLLSKSKYKDFEGFGRYSDGSIMLQEHNSTVSFRNIKIRSFGK